MINKNFICALLIAKKIRKPQLAEELGITLRTLYCKLNGINQFTVVELVTMADILGIADLNQLIVR